MYKQLERTLTGSAVSCILADIVMDDLKTLCIAQLDFKTIFYYSSVDDVIICVSCNKIAHRLEILNSYHNKLPFTIEIEKKGKIPFFDTWLIINENNVIVLVSKRKLFLAEFYIISITTKNCNGL